MRRTYAISFAPFAVVAVGWLWQYVGHRLAFGASSPEYGFYRRSNGPALERLLFDGPMTVVLSSLLIVAVVSCRALYRQGHRLLLAFYVLLCLGCAAIFIAPGVWFIDIPGRGEFLL